MIDWKDDKRVADRYMPEVKRILGEHLLFAGTTVQDQLENTDLIVLTASQIRIGVRVRNPGYYERYGDQFTIRCSRPGGTKTELEKIVDGWGDYFFYGHGNGETLFAWGLGDLAVLRDYIDANRLFDDAFPRPTKTNRDGSSSFVAFCWQELPRQFLVASSNLPLALTPASNGRRGANGCTGTQDACR